MLTHLSIRHILLLKACDIPFAPGLNVLTGETGAGKSILLDALGLVLGERSDASLVRQGETQASVVAEFSIENHAAAQALLSELELAQEPNLLLRRTLTADGKSRAFINDAPVSVATLKRFGEVLVMRHGQHDQRGLMDNKTHRALLDAFGGYAPLVEKTAQAYHAWRAAGAALAEVEARGQAAARDEAWLKQMVEELSALAPVEGEEETLAAKRKAAQEARHSIGALKEASERLTDTGGVALQLRQVAKLLARMPELEGQIAAPLEQAEQAIEEISVAVDRALAASDIDPAEIEASEDRLHALRGAARKFNVAVALLPDCLADATAKLRTLTNLDKEMRAAKAALAEAEETYRSLSETLRAAREKAGEQLAKQVAKELKPLHMAHTQLRVVQQPLPPQQWGEHGLHQVMFEVATNKGMPFGPLTKVASGGELSRLLLAMKVVLHAGDEATAIFDEIDTGTGGAVAEAIGGRLRNLAEEGQVIVVTHAPQVAALASHHLRISKSGSKAVATQVEVLDDAARNEEVARMLSGARVSEEARKAASKLLEAAS